MKGYGGPSPHNPSTSRGLSLATRSHSKLMARRFEFDAADDPRVREREIKALRGSWADTPGGGTEDLLAERRRERELEERKAQRRNVGRPR